MFTNLISLINLDTKPFKIIGSLLLVCFYAFYFPFGTIGYVVVLVAFCISAYAFFSEKKLIRQGHERFHGDNLFFRYGNELTYTIFSIPVDPKWESEESTNFANGLMDRIIKYFNEYFGATPLNGQQLVNIISVTDSDRTSDTRNFIKISFKGSRGALFTRFITYQLVGKYIVLHRAAFLLGIAHWYDILFFILFSPFSIWLWLYSQIKGEYSVYSRIARGIGNSFEVLDVRAFYESSATLITNATKDELKAHDLYTDELAAQFNINFNGTINQYGGGNTVVSQIK
jgi:hypothetical protein